MGGSSWAYFVPYQQDIEKAFFDLQQRVFDSGDYWLVPREIDEDTTEDEYVQRSIATGIFDAEDDEHLRSIYQELSARYSEGKPTTIEGLLRWNGETGTHSILDVSYFTDDPTNRSLFTAIPVPDEQLIEWFGSTHPSHALVVDKSFQVTNYRQGSQANYLIVYEDDEPSEIYLAGFSGD